MLRERYAHATYSQMKTVINYGALALLVASGCGDDPAGLPASTETAATDYSALVRASYEDAVTAARSVETANAALVADPSEATLQAAKDAWLAARPYYLQTEVFRFYDGPIDGNDGDPEGRINSWPMDEASVDYVEGMPEAGRIADPSFTIDAETLAAGNGEGGDTDVTVGWHPIEFLLWGQDLTAPSERMPGQRPFTDYSTAPHADRRGEYLMATSALLVADLQAVADEWAPGEDNYRQHLTETSPSDVLQKILTGMIVLSGFETGGERLQAALDAGDQEEEHSCFSDNTKVDMVEDVRGVQNVWLGRYRRLDGSMVSGTGVEVVVRELDASLADDLTARIQTSLDLAEALESPFDLEIQPGNAEGNARVQALIDSLRTQEMLLSQVFIDLGFSVPTPE